MGSGNTTLNKAFNNRRAILSGAGFLEGDWKAYEARASKVNLIEPVLEGIMQLFFQSIILYIIYGPGTSNAHSRNIKKFFI